MRNSTKKTKLIMSEREIKKIETSNAPKPVGAYSQAVSAGDLVFLAGQIPLDINTGKIESSDIKEQTSLVLDNAKNILKASGLGLDRVVKVDIFLTDLEDFGAVNEIYAARFNTAVKPARCVVQVSKLPKGAKIELACVAVK